MARKIEDLIIASVSKKLTKFGGQVASAGFFPDQKYDTPAAPNVAYIAAIQNYGDPSHNIPARPFMTNASKENREQWIEDAKRGIRAIISGKASVDQVLDQLGGEIAADIQGAIAKTSSPALSPVTVMLRGMRRNDPGLVVTGKTVGEAAARVAAGQTNYGASAKPLVDTGLLIASVTHKVQGNA